MDDKHNASNYILDVKTKHSFDFYYFCLDLKNMRDYFFKHIIS